MYFKRKVIKTALKHWRSYCQRSSLPKSPVRISCKRRLILCVQKINSIKVQLGLLSVSCPSSLFVMQGKSLRTSIAVSSSHSVMYNSSHKHLKS